MGLDIQQIIEQAIDVQGGVRSNVEPYYLEKNQMYRLQNVDLDDLGARKKRDGCLSYGTGGVECGGLAPWVFADQTRYLVGYWDNHLYTTDGDSVWSRADSTGVSIVTNHVLHGTFGRVLDTTATTGTIYELDLVSTQTIISGLARDMIYEDNNLIVSCNAAGLRCYSAHTGGSITLMDTEVTPGNAYGLAWDGSYVFSAVDDYGINSYAVTSTGVFVPNATSPASLTPFQANIRAVAADTAVSLVFAGDVNGDIISYANAAGAMSMLTGLTLSGSANVRAMTINPSYSVVYTANGSDGLFVAQFNATGGMSLLQSITDRAFYDIDLRGSYLFAAGGTEVNLYRVDTDGTLLYRSSIDNDDDSHVSILAAGDDQVIAGTNNGDLESYLESSGTGAITVNTSVSVGGGVLGCYYDASKDWLYAGGSEAGLLLYNHSTTGGLSLIDSDATYESYGVYPHGDYMVGASNKDGITTYYVDTNGNISVVDNHDPGQVIGVWSDGTFVYAGDYSAGIRTYNVDTNGGLSLVDSDDPGGAGRTVWGDGTYVYLADYTYGPRVYYPDASGNLSLVNSYSLAGNCEGVWYNGSFLFACQGGAGLFVFEPDGSGALTFKSSDDQGGNATRVHGGQEYIFLANYQNGVETYAVSSAGTLTHQVESDPGGNIYGIWYDGEYVYCGDGSNDILYKMDVDGQQLSLESEDTRSGTNFVALAADTNLIFSFDSVNSDGIGLWEYGYSSYDPFTAQTAHFVHSVYASFSDPTLSALTTLPERGIGTVNASIHPRSVEWWQGRLWFGGLADADAYEDAIYWSDILNGLSIDLSNNVRIDAEKGDAVMKILPVRSTSPRMYIFKEHSIHAFDVVWTSGAQIPTTENTIDTVNSKVVPLTTDVGTVAPNSVVYASGAGDSDVFFLAQDGVRSLKRVEQDTAGGAGPPISDPIKDIIDRINWDKAGLATSAIYDHKLFMAIPVDGSSYNNLTIVYDLDKKRWIGEYTFQPSDMIVANFNDEKTKLYGAWNHITDDVNAAGHSGVTGRHIYSLLDSDATLDPSNTAVEYIEETRAYSFGHLGKKKRWNWAEFEFTPAQTTITIAVYYKREDENYHLLKYLGIEPKYVFPILPAQLPWDLQDPARTLERVSLMDIPVGRTLQLKLETNSPGAFGTRTTRISAWPLEELWE